MSSTIRSLRIAAAASLAIGGVPALSAQASMTPPAMVNAVCETVRAGMGPAHDKHEESWARAGEAVKGSASTLALQSVTGPAVSCWLTVAASYADIGKNNDLSTNDPAYSKLLPSLVADDGKYISDARSYIAVLRPEMSAGEMPNVLTRRFTTWDEWRVRFGTEAMFIAAVKAYRAASIRAGANPEFRTYEVVQGASSTTYWMFSSTSTMAGFDAAMAGDDNTGAGFTADDHKILDEAAAKSVVSRVSNIWAYNSALSGLTAEQRGSDPFWKRKALPAKP
ncbi:MAG: hypothetical protein ACHQSE_08380 [Gemmatimonadales bacterium]